MHVFYRKSLTTHEIKSRDYPLPLKKRTWGVPPLFSQTLLDLFFILPVLCPDNDDKDTGKDPDQYQDNVIHRRKNDRRGNNNEDPEQNYRCRKDSPVFREILKK